MYSNGVTVSEKGPGLLLARNGLFGHSNTVDILVTTVTTNYNNPFYARVNKMSLIFDKRNAFICLKIFTAIIQIPK